jgi:threonyl-tRNA synthetase
MNIVLPDGSIRQAADGATAFDFVKELSVSLARAAVAVRINDLPCDLSSSLHDNDRVEALTFDSPEGKRIFWHSSSHVLAQAVQELFPSAKSQSVRRLKTAFTMILTQSGRSHRRCGRNRSRAKEIVGRKLDIVRSEPSKEDLRAWFKARGEIYKLELLDDIEGNPSVYRQGEWQDLCRGPHIMNTSIIKAFRILSVAGAYWRGNEKNRMLQRIYAISFPNRRSWMSTCILSKRPRSVIIAN